MIAPSIKLGGDLESALVKFEARVRSDVLRSGAFAMATVVYEEAKARVPEGAGTLKAALYTVHVDNKSDDTVQTYQISWNKRKAPHGHLVEYGYYQKYQVVLTSSGDWITLKNRPLARPRWVGPRPFMRPAFDLISVAIEAGKKRIAERLNGQT